MPKHPPCGRAAAARTLFLFSVVCAFGRPAVGGTEATAPPQPLLGPGGKIALFSGVLQFGPYSASQTEPTSDFYIFQPAGKLGGSLPVVLFIHGALLNTEGVPLGDQPSNYQGWINQLVVKGYTVVFPVSFDSASPNTWLPVLTDDWIASIGLLQSKTGGLIPPATDQAGIQAFCAGHSYGAYDCFTLLQSLYLVPKPNAPLPRAIAAMNPALGAPGRSLNLTSIPPGTYVVEVKSDEEVLNQLQTADQLWEFLEAEIPSSQRDYLELITDKHGTPEQLGNLAGR